MRHLQLLAFLITACLVTAATDSKSRVRSSPESIVKEYCQKDFDGARTSSQTYSQVDHLYLWPEEPGWDTVTIVKSYRIVSSQMRGNHAVVTVEYQTLGDIGGSEFLEDHTSTKVAFKLELGSKEWTWKNDEPVLEVSNLAWRITYPIMQPHISVPYAIKHVASLVSTENDPEHKLEKVLARLRAVQ